jgi:hypothetical protein
LQVGPARFQARRFTKTTPKTYECARAQECQWQIERGGDLCPPRLALSKGIDPRICTY